MDSSSLLRFNRSTQGEELVVNNNSTATEVPSNVPPVTSYASPNAHYTSMHGLRPISSSLASNNTYFHPRNSHHLNNYHSSISHYNRPSNSLNHRPPNLGGVQRHMSTSFFNRYENIRSSYSNSNGGTRANPAHVTGNMQQESVINEMNETSEQNEYELSINHST